MLTLATPWGILAVVTMIELALALLHATRKEL